MVWGRSPLDLAFADCAAVVLCNMTLMLCFDEDECKIDEVRDRTCIRVLLSAGVLASLAATQRSAPLVGCPYQSTRPFEVVCCSPCISHTGSISWKSP